MPQFHRCERLSGDHIKREKDIIFIILDIKMPRMNGIEFLKELRRLDKNIPVVILSAFGTKSELIEAIEYGINKFIQKPVLDYDAVRRRTRDLFWAIVIEVRKVTHLVSN